MSNEFSDLENEIEKSKSKYAINAKRSLEELRMDLLNMRYLEIHGKELALLSDENPKDSHDKKRDN